MIYKSDSQQNQLNLTMRDENGNAVQAALIACTVRPGRGLSLTLDVLAPDKIAASEEDFAAIEQAVSAFVYGEMEYAASTGIPVGRLAPDIYSGTDEPA